MHYPIFLDLRSRPVLVVGGGTVAFAKTSGLLEAGARITVVAPRIDAGLEPLTVLRREFQPGDLDGKWLVIAAATPEVNRQVVKAAEQRRIFVNAVDDVQSATAYLGGVVRKGGVTLAISTGGRAPALAGLLREALENVLPDDIAEWTSTAEGVRAFWKRERVPIGERRPLLLEALNSLYRRSA